jgi:glycosyltransferase involved in cell wall biosynthesis
MKKLISIISPCYNEELNVGICHERVRAIFQEKLPQYDYEHIFCDNASTDQTVTILRQIGAQDKHVKVILNARNFGPFRSLFNGLLSSKGDAVVVMLAVDLQDPPELIVDFVKRWEEGHEIVYGIRKKREESLAMLSVRRLYYKMVERLANIHIPPNVGEFQLIDKVVVDALRKFDDYYPYLRGMIASCGFKSIGIEYTWKARQRSISKNNLYQLIDQGLNGLISFSNIPLRLCMLIGFLMSFICLVYALVVFVVNLIWFRHFAMPGIATIIVAIFFFMGIQMFYLGVLGEYIGAIHAQTRKKPLVIERGRINF